MFLGQCQSSDLGLSAAGDRSGGERQSRRRQPSRKGAEARNVQHVSCRSTTNASYETWALEQFHGHALTPHRPTCVAGSY